MTGGGVAECPSPVSTRPAMVAGFALGAYVARCSWGDRWARFEGQSAPPIGPNQPVTANSGRATWLELAVTAPKVLWVCIWPDKAGRGAEACERRPAARERVAERTGA